jgi:ABC-2 type transport system permease protein
MTTAAAPMPARRNRVTGARVIVSEWVKFRSLRSSWLTLALIAVFVIGLGTAFSAARAAHWSRMDPVERATFDPTTTSLGGVFLAQLVVGVLGVLVVTGEYSSGTIRATLAAVPRRLPVLFAKTLVFAVAVIAVAVPSVFVAFALGQRMLSSRHVQTTLSAPDVTRAVIGAALYLTAVGLFGVALGWLLRQTAGAVATLFGLLLVLPILMHFLPASWSDTVGKWLPANAGQAVIAVRPEPHSLGPWVGFGVLCAYVVVALVASAVLLLRRDA